MTTSAEDKRWEDLYEVAYDGWQEVEKLIDNMSKAMTPIEKAMFITYIVEHLCEVARWKVRLTPEEVASEQEPVSTREDS